MGRGRRTSGRLLGTVVLALATTVATFAGGAGSAAAATPDGPAALQRLVTAERSAATGITGHRLTSGHARAAAQRAERQAVAAEDDVADLSLAPGCARSTRSKVTTGVFLYSPTRATYDYVLTGTGGLSRTGSIKAKKDAVVRASLPGVRLGTYRVVLTRRGATTPSADQTFDVLPCVQVKASCAALTLTNPVGNPAALVTYGTKHADPFDVELAPGESRTVRVDDAKVVVTATSVDESVDADLGRTTVKVKQSCKHGPAVPGQNAVQTRGASGCGSGSAAGSTTFFWLAQKSLKNRTWEVVDGDRAIVASGSFKNGGDRTVALTPGSYTYRSLANAIAEPFEEIAFSVLECVTVTTTCHQVDVTNPNGVAVEAFLIDTDDEADGSETDPGEGEGSATVEAHGSTTIPWFTRSAVLLAFAGDPADGGFVVLAAPFPLDEEDGDLPELTIPQDC